MKNFNTTMFAASSANYRTIDDYVSVWTNWAEMLLEKGYQEDALKVIKHVLLRRKTNTENQ